LIVGKEKWNTLEFFAFIILVFGTLIYNEILIVPIHFMKYNTKKERDTRDK
jgi:hypothetical protein